MRTSWQWRSTQDQDCPPVPAVSEGEDGENWKEASGKAIGTACLKVGLLGPVGNTEEVVGVWRRTESKE